MGNGTNNHENGNGFDKSDKESILRAILQMTSLTQKNTEEMHNLALNVQPNKSNSLLNQGTFILGTLVNLIILVAFAVSIRKDVDTNSKMQPVVDTLVTQQISMQKDIDQAQKDIAQSKTDRSDMWKRLQACENDLKIHMQVSTKPN